MKRKLALSVLIIIVTCLRPSLFAQNQHCLAENWIPVEHNLPASTWQVLHMIESNGTLYVLTIDTSINESKLYSFNGVTWKFESNINTSGVPILAMIAYNNEVYIGGSFSHVNSIPDTYGIAKWDGTNWVTMGGKSYNPVLVFHVFNGDLYAGGTFTSINGNSYGRMAKWDGTAWSALGTGIGSGIVETITNHNGDIYAGGLFTSAGGTTVSNLAKWDGSSWSDVGGGTNSIIKEMVAYNGEVFVYGNNINSFGGNLIKSMARWDGTNWTSCGVPTSGGLNGIWDFEIYKGTLYAGSLGSTFVNGQMAEGFIRWNGSTWEVMTGVGFNGWPGAVRDLVIYNGRLYACGQIGYSCGNTMNNLIQLCDYNDCGSISGVIYVDANKNCVQDQGEIGLPNQMISISPGTSLRSTNDTGYFWTMMDTGNYSISFPNPPTYYNLICPSSPYNVTVSKGTKITSKDFAMEATANISDLMITLTSVIPPRPGFQYTYNITYKNVGTVTKSGTIELEHDSALQYQSTTTPYNSYMNQTISWNYSNLVPFETRSFSVTFKVDISTTLGDGVSSLATIDPVSNDENPANNIVMENDTVVGSYDHNDKQVNPAGVGKTGNIPYETDLLTYTVRFQNTGTDTAFNVKILDQIDFSLDLTTLNTLASSHSYTFMVMDNSWVAWNFENILLPDSNTNELLSHGFVRYSIKPLQGLATNSEVSNHAAIYFDFNYPIYTDTITSTFYSGLEEFPNGDQNLSALIYPDPFHDQAHLVANQPISDGSLRLYDIHGRMVMEMESVYSNVIPIRRKDLPRGVYIFKLSNGNGLSCQGKFIIQ